MSTPPLMFDAPTFENRDELERWQLERLQRLIERVAAKNLFWQQRLRTAQVQPGDLQSLADLSRLPLLTKQELIDDQRHRPPYGTNLTAPRDHYTRLHQTSGTTTGVPLRWLDTPANWEWMLACWREIYQLMGIRPTDRFCFPFSFGPFLGFWAGFEGALAEGLFCVAAGGMSSEARLSLIRDHHIHWVGCTPTYALRLLEVAQQQGLEPASLGVQGLLVAGEPGGLVGATRAQLETGWGARVVDHWGMTELGPLAIETEARPGALTLLESQCIAEVVDPASGEPVPPGTIGELVITNLGRIDSPVIRYRTGDLVRLATDDHPQLYAALEGGILGRNDDMLLIRGNNVFPASLEAIIREHADVAEFRLVVGSERGMTSLTVQIEPLPTATDRAALLCERIAGVIKQRLQFHADVEAVPSGTLPRFEMKAKRLIRRS